MPVDADRLRQVIESLLKGDKSLNEQDVKTAAGKQLKVRPEEIGAGAIREVIPAAERLNRGSSSRRSRRSSASASARRT